MFTRNVKSSEYKQEDSLLEHIFLMMLLSLVEMLSIL